MNYYANLYYDDYNSNDIKTHISIVEGIYQVDGHQKVRVIGDVNITENMFIKYRKKSFDVININQNTITLKKSHYNTTTRSILYEQTYILLQDLLITEGYTPENIQHIITNITVISNNVSIKTNNDCLGEWIAF